MIDGAPARIGRWGEATVPALEAARFLAGLFLAAVCLTCSQLLPVCKEGGARFAALACGAEAGTAPSAAAMLRRGTAGAVGGLRSG